jgi:GNAT superfamily N-acetyltransferase
MSRIIQANLEHLYWIRLLWEMLVEEKPPIYPHTSESTANEFTCTVARMMQDPKVPFAVFLAFKGHRAIGFIGGEIRTRHIGIPRHYGTCHWLYVRPEHRAKGVAEELILTGLQWLRERPILDVGSNGEQQTVYVDTVELMSTYGDNSWEDRGFAPYCTYYFRDVSDIARGRKPKPSPVQQPQPLRAQGKK